MKKGKILMVLPVMKGGGAERVASILLNAFCENGYECEFLVTSCKKDDILRIDLNNDIPVTDLHTFSKTSFIKKLLFKLLSLFSSVICKPFESFKINVPASFAYLSFYSQYYFEIQALEKKLYNEPGTIVISFLQPSIPITLLAARKLKNKIIISERGDPSRLMKKRYGYNFIKKYYSRADKIIFQTDDAKKTYPHLDENKLFVIFNPLKTNLPEPYFGPRDKYISTFCRISAQKNLLLLISAFAEFHKEYPEYRLKIIGDPQNSQDNEVLSNVKLLSKDLKIIEYIDFHHFSRNVHSMILKDAMYINSSDYEGMSNAMLEAMAIGMPVICTDCPIGGASSVIVNKSNGILVPVGDKQALTDAMKKIASDSCFSSELSQNAAKIRENLSIKTIAHKWMELF